MCWIYTYKCWQTPKTKSEHQITQTEAKIWQTIIKNMTWKSKRANLVEIMKMHSVFQNLFFLFVFLLRACIFSFFLWFTVHAHFFPARGHSTIQSLRPLKTIPNSFLIMLLVTAIPTPWHSYMDNREYHNHATKFLPIAKFIAAQLFWRTISFKTLRYAHSCLGFRYWGEPGFQTTVRTISFDFFNAAPVGLNCLFPFLALPLSTLRPPFLTPVRTFLHGFIHFPVVRFGNEGNQAKWINNHNQNRQKTTFQTRFFFHRRMWCNKLGALGPVWPTLLPPRFHENDVSFLLCGVSWCWLWQRGFFEPELGKQNETVWLQHDNVWKGNILVRMWFALMQKTWTANNCKTLYTCRNWWTWWGGLTQHFPQNRPIQALDVAVFVYTRSSTA